MCVCGVCVYVCLFVCVCVCCVCVCVCCVVCVCMLCVCVCVLVTCVNVSISMDVCVLLVAELCLCTCVTTLRVGPCNKICTYSFVDCICQQHKHHPLCVTLPLFVCLNTSASDGRGDEERVWPPPFDRSHRWILFSCKTSLARGAIGRHDTKH